MGTVAVAVAATCDDHRSLLLRFATDVAGWAPRAVRTEARVHGRLPRRGPERAHMPLPARAIVPICGCSRT